jgi:uncharacterized RDD family membrane protein YckC
MTHDLIRVPAGLTTEGRLGRRYFARLIDTIIIGAGGALTFAFAAALTTDHFTTLLIGLPAVILVWIGYGGLLESSRWQATVGKKLLGLRVYDSDGARPKLMQTIQRNIVKDGPFVLLGFLPAGRVLVLLLVAAHLVVLHRSPVYQAIHDRVAATWVAAPESSIQLRLT